MINEKNCQPYCLNVNDNSQVTNKSLLCTHVTAQTRYLYSIESIVTAPGGGRS